MYLGKRTYLPTYLRSLYGGHFNWNPTYPEDWINQKFSTSIVLSATVFWCLMAISSVGRFFVSIFGYSGWESCKTWESLLVNTFIRWIGMLRGDPKKRRGRNDSLSCAKRETSGAPPHRHDTYSHSTGSRHCKKLILRQEGSLLNHECSLSQFYYCCLSISTREVSMDQSIDGGKKCLLLVFISFGSLC